MDFKKEFLEEAAELLTRLERICLSLERNPSDLKSIEEAFRIAHTLKGSALSVGFTHFGSIAHRFEDILDQCRVPSSGAAIRSEELLRYLDLLSTYAKGLQQDHAFVMVEPVVAPHSTANAKAPAVPVAAPSPAPNLTATSADQNLYYRAFLQGLRLPAEEKDLTLFADLSRLAMTFDKTATFAAVACDSLASHPVLNAISRVCLVHRLGYSNHLEVVSSHGDGPDNLLVAGYRCFVAANSSLFNMSPHNFRVFPSARRLIMSYDQTEKPPQRSIARVAQMGYESGICLGLFHGGLMSGLLFLNARNAFLSKLPERYLPVLSYLGVLAHKHFGREGQEPLYDELWRPHGERLRGSAFDATVITAEVQRLVPEISPAAGPVRIQFTGPSKIPTMVANGHIAHILARLACATAAQDVTIAAAASDLSLTLTCTFNTDSPLSWQGPMLRAICCEAKALGYDAEPLSESTLALSTTFDKICSSSEVGYSVESEGRQGL